MRPKYRDSLVICIVYADRVGAGVGEESLARHHLRLEDHHRVALQGRLRHRLGRRRLDDLRLDVATVALPALGPAHPMTREITDLLWKAMNEQLDWRLDDLGLPEPVLDVLNSQGL